MHYRWPKTILFDACSNINNTTLLFRSRNATLPSCSLSHSLNTQSLFLAQRKLRPKRYKTLTEERWFLKSDNVHLHVRVNLGPLKLVTQYCIRLLFNMIEFANTAAVALLMYNTLWLLKEHLTLLNTIDIKYWPKWDLTGRSLFLELTILQVATV